MQNNYFWGTPPNDYFCLETWSRYYYNIKRRKFKTILIWRSSKKMNRKKSLLILYYLWKKVSKFSNAQKKVFHAFSFQLCSTANSKFSYLVSLCGIDCIKIQTISLVLNLSILAEIFCVWFTLTSSSASDWKKSPSLNFFSVAGEWWRQTWTFFQSREWNKNMGCCAMLGDFILPSRDFQSLMEIRLYMGLKVQGLDCMTASGFRVRVTGLVFCL